TGSNPARGLIADSPRKCPNNWPPKIAEAMTLARSWNRVAALTTRYRDKFSKEYKELDTKLKSGFDYKCVPDGGGRCQHDKNAAYWYFAGDLRICPAMVTIQSPEDRALSMLMALYGKEEGVNEKRLEEAAREAKRLYSANTPTAAQVVAD